MAIDLSGRKALVTGGGRGIGAAISLKLAECGADIAINYARGIEAAEETAATIRNMGRKVSLHQGNVGEDDDCARIVADAVAAHDGLDLLVNNAGIASRGHSVAKTDPREMEKVMTIHAFGAFYMTHHALPHLIAADRGDVIMISSVAADGLGANGSPYNMAKAAINALAGTLAKEVNRKGVYVNTVSPGLTATDMGTRLAKAVTGQDIEDLNAKFPFGHVCQPEEIANWVALMASPENSFATGQNIRVSGGDGGVTS